MLINKLPSDLHVFVFCAAEYAELLNSCVESIRGYIVDPILSVNVVTNTKIKIDGCNIIKDVDFWKLLDPDFKHRKLYNHNWYKQQFFKLSVDKFVDGNVLIVDVEVLFNGPTEFLHNGTVNMYVDPLFHRQSAKNFTKSTRHFNKVLLDLDVYHADSFVSEAMIFSTNVLKKLRNDIEEKYKKSWLDVMNDFLLVGIEKNPEYTLSEFELYGSYFYKNYYDLINKIMCKLPCNFISRRPPTTSNSGGKTKWITFYEQIRDNTWPDCENEADFINLPAHIQKECIEIFGYKPELHGNA